MVPSAGHENAVSSKSYKAVIGTFTIDTELRISDQGALVAETASVDVAIEAQDLALLQRVGLEPDAELLVSTALESLVERLVSLQLSKPFGLGLQLKAFDVDADVVWVFVDLLP